MTRNTHNDLLDHEELREAADVPYDDTTSGFTVADVQEAIDGLITGGFQVIIGSGTAVISTGLVKIPAVELPIAGVLTAVRLFADVSGSIVIDVWKDSYANYPPVVGDSITASAKPTISSAIKSVDTTLTGWTTAFAEGDTLRFNVDSVTTIQQVTLAFRFRRT